MSVPPRRELSRAVADRAWLLVLLGRDDEAAGALDRAVALQGPLLVELPTVPQVREALGKSLNVRALLRQDRGDPEAAEVDFDGSLKQYRRLAEDYPDRLSYRRALARGLGNLGRLLAETDRQAEAEAALAESAVAYEQLVGRAPGVSKLRRDLAIVLDNLGTALERRGRSTDALGAYDRAVAAAESGARRFPTVVDHREVLGTALLNRGRLRRALGDAAGSGADLSRAVEVLGQLVERDPDRPSYRRLLAVARAEVARSLAAAGDAAGAEPLYREAIASLEALHDDDPDDREILRSLAFTEINYGSLPVADAAAQLEQAVGHLDALAEGHTGAAALLRQRASALLNLGIARFFADEKPAAEHAFAGAAAHVEALLASPEATPADHRLAATVQGGLAQLRLDDGRSEAGRAALALMIAHARAAATPDPARADLGDLIDATETLVTSLLSTGARDEAADAAAGLADALPGRPELRVEAARLLGLCLAAAPTAEPGDEADADAGDEAPAPSAGAVALADRAMAQLRVALDAGYDPEALRAAAPRLGPLADRDDFRALLGPPAVADDRPVGEGD